MNERQRHRASGPYLWASLVTGILLVAVRWDLPTFVRGVSGPNEWMWRRRLVFWRDALPFVELSGGCLALLLALTGTRLLHRRPRLASALILSAGIGFGWAFQYSMLAFPTPRSGARVASERTVSAIVTSHFTHAISVSAFDVANFVDHHASLLPNLELHSQTHPPGAILFFRAVFEICSRSARLTAALASFAVERGVDPALVDPLLRDSAVAASLLAPFLLMAAAAAVCVPITGIARTLGCSRAESLRIGLLAIVLPGMVLMTPQIMQLVTLLIACTASFLLRATTAETSRRRTVAFTALAACTAGCALFVSYSALVFLGFVLCFVFAVRFEQPRRDRTLAICATCLAGALILNFVPALFGHEPIQAFRTALALHADGITKFRSYPKWIVVNLWDFAVFLGFPLAVLALFSVARATRSVLRGDVETAPRLLPVLCGALLLLDLSGTVRGEVGRIWMPLMPLFLVAVLADRQGPTPSSTGSAPVHETFIPDVGLMVLLLACCVVLRLSWFP